MSRLSRSGYGKLTADELRALQDLAVERDDQAEAEMLKALAQRDAPDESSQAFAEAAQLMSRFSAEDFAMMELAVDLPALNLPGETDEERARCNEELTQEFDERDVFEAAARGISLKPPLTAQERQNAASARQVRGYQIAGRDRRPGSAQEQKDYPYLLRMESRNERALIAAREGDIETLSELIAEDARDREELGLPLAQRWPWWAMIGKGPHSDQDPIKQRDVKARAI